MTVKDLKALAKEYGIAGYSKLNKAQLEEVIRDYEENKKELTKKDLEEIITEDTQILEFKDREEWLKLRDGGIGGSDIGAILGVNKYKSKIEVFIDKTQGSKEIENNYTHFGHKLESVIFDEFSERHPELKCYTVPYTLKRGVCLANLDGMIYDPQKDRYGVLEIKTTSVFNKSQWAGEEIPQSYYAQVQHYLYVTGLEFAYVSCLIGGNEYIEFKVDKSPQDTELIKNEATNFWRNHVETDSPPTLDGSDAYTQYLLEKSDCNSEGEKIIDSIGLYAMKINEMDAKIKELEEIQAKAKQKIIAKMNENKCLRATSCGHKFSIITSSRLHFDKKRMFDEHEDIKELAKIYTQPKEYKYLQITKAKESR